MRPYGWWRKTVVRGKVKETQAPSASRARHLPPGGRLRLHCIGNNPSVKIEDFATSHLREPPKLALLTSGNPVHKGGLKVVNPFTGSKGQLRGWRANIKRTCA